MPTLTRRVPAERQTLKQPLPKVGVLFEVNLIISKR